MEAEGLFAGVIQAAPITQGRVQQDRGAEDVGGDELHGAVDGAVHMRFRGEIDHSVGLEEVNISAMASGIADIGLTKE